MATFTETFSEHFEMYGIFTVEGALERRSTVGLRDYPIYDENFRDDLDLMILRRFWNREIAHETMSIFAMRLDTKLREMMPYYNRLYESEQIQFDPMKTIDLGTNTESSSKHKELGTALSTNKGDSGSRSVSSTTPQNQLSENGDYADSMTDATSETLSTANSSQSGEGTQDASTDTRVSGYQANPSDLVRKYRESLINVSEMLLDRLEILFSSVYQTSDENFERNGYFYGYGIAQ